jgi:hypothetical protein
MNALLKWRVIAQGVWNNYPVCCILQFVRGYSISYADELYAEQRTRGKIPVWSGTGYVPCRGCAQRWVVPR